MEEKQKQIADLRDQITKAEQGLEAAKRALFDLTKNELGTASSNQEAEGTVIEGIFNGENMIGPEGKTYPVPANYASKSKIVEGDKLKLTIGKDGSFVFKQIGPVARRHILGQLKFENNAYYVDTEADTFNVLYASITYHKAKPGDKVSIVIPAEGQPTWSVLESVIHDISPEDKKAAEIILEQRVAEEMKQIPATEEPVITAAETAPSEVVTPPESPQVEPQVITPDAATVLHDDLGINDLEIRGPKNVETPVAVNTNSVNEGVIAPAALPNIEPRANSISELEI